jgi:hypothetical protein
VLHTRGKLDASATNMVVDIKLDDTGIDPHDVGGKYGYRIGHTDGTYTIPDRVLNTTEDRPVELRTNELLEHARN